MKKINNYIVEKFKISKDIDSSSYDEILEQIYTLTGLNTEKAKEKNSEKVKKVIKERIEKNKSKNFRIIVSDKYSTLTNMFVPSSERNNKLYIESTTLFNNVINQLEKNKDNVESLLPLEAPWGYCMKGFKDNDEYLILCRTVYPDTLYQYYTLIIYTD